VVIIGADVSGNTSGGCQSRHIAIVLGTEESISRTYRKIGVRAIHMVSMNDTQRQQVFQNLAFGGSDLVGLCLNVERQKTIDAVFQDPRFIQRSMPKHRLHQHFDYLLFRKIRDIVEPFAYERRREIRDIVMQCDPDMSKTGANWRMRTADGGRAYELADAVAWCNEHGRRLKHCREMDLAGRLREEMILDFLK